MRRRHRSIRKKIVTISSAFRAYTSVIVAYDQSVRENAISNPAPSAGAATIGCVTANSSIFLLPFFRRFAAARYDAVTITSATTNVSIAHVSAAKTADEKLIRCATFPKGTSDAR
jgi:hypothetical protein